MINNSFNLQSISCLTLEIKRGEIIVLKDIMNKEEQNGTSR
jgi:hypothetical protein